MNKLLLGRSNLFIAIMMFIIISVLYFGLAGLFFNRYPFIALFFGLVSAFVSAYFLSVVVNKEALQTHKHLNLLFVYALNTFAFPFFIGFLTIYIEKLVAPMQKLFIETFSNQIAINYLTFLGPYFLILTISIHFLYFYKANKKTVVKLMHDDAKSSISLSQLKMQLSPHFLFNNISTLTSIIEENPKAAVNFSENLSNIYRYLLEKEKEDIVSLDEELKFTKMYIELLSVRFEEAFDCNIEVVDCNNKYIIPLSIQQAIENIVKHNEINAETPLKATVFVDENKVVITNTLNPKRTIKTSFNMGIKNISDRYLYFTDEKVTVFKTKDEFRIELPILTLEA
ncbi:sensor histidine kinase [Thalassobellus suaedae]|uniref:Histidine kinase n=1 Tax=Thalassobellus suaedae TaxID=3074124 RepID=A0ABY9Y782_9FLAO|nr:histidine kinase [Flavobacteriaceae bacterium HL-DH10]